MTKFVFSTMFAAALLPLHAQTAAPNPSQEPGITRQQADQILNELRQIRQLLEQQKAAASAAQPQRAARATLNMDGVAMLGSKDAPLTIVEYTDYQCPFCQRFHVTAFNELKKAYIDTGKVRFYSRDLPLDFHPNAMRAAMAARCAGEQGQNQFWNLRNVMGANPNMLDMEHILGFAADLKLDISALRGCVEGEKYKNAIQADLAEAMKVGAQGTPTFVIGKSTPNGVDGEIVEGAMPFQVFDQKLKELAK